MQTTPIGVVSTMTMTSSSCQQCHLATADIIIGKTMMLAMTMTYAVRFLTADNGAQ